MKRIISMLLVFTIMTLLTASCAAETQSARAAEIKLQIGNPVMAVDGVEREIDPGRDTAPIISEDRTLLPVRAAAGAMGSAIEWDVDTQTVILAKGDVIILLVIGSETAFLNETAYTLDCAPIIQNERTMLPIRFIAESFGYSVEWDGETQTVTLIFVDENDGDENDDIDTAAISNTDSETAAVSIVVYFSRTGTTRPHAEK